MHPATASTCGINQKGLQLVQLPLCGFPHPGFRGNFEELFFVAFQLSQARLIVSMLIHENGRNMGESMV